MTAGELLSLAPLALVGLAGIAAMALAPLAPMRAIRGAAGALMGAGLVVALLRVGAEPAPAYALLADDGLARFGGALSILAGLGVLAFVQPEADAREGPALVAIATAGAVALSGATHAATLFLGLEITTLAMIALALLPRRGASVEAAYKFFIMSGVGAASLLLGMSLAFAETGSLMLAEWGGAAPMMLVGAGLMLAGLGFKFALVPFHMWAPDLFAGAPASVAAIAGAVSKLAVAVALLRVVGTPPGGALFPAGLALAGGGAAIFGNLVALRQDGLARMLGYSSVAHSGYLALMLAGGGPILGDAVLVYIAVYAPTVIAALCVAGALGKVGRGGLTGLARADPLAGAALAVALLSMAGLPPTAGFLGKVYLFSTLARAEAWALLAAAATGTALAFVYYLRFTLDALGSSQAPPSVRLTLTERTTLAAALALMLAPGIYPEPLIALVGLALHRAPPRIRTGRRAGTRGARPGGSRHMRAARARRASAPIRAPRHDAEPVAPSRFRERAAARPRPKLPAESG